MTSLPGLAEYLSSFKQPLLMRKSDFDLKFYTMSYSFCLLNFIFKESPGF